LASVRKTSTIFYVEKLFSFLCRHFLQNSLFGFRQLPQLRKLTMVDLEGPPPYLAATSHHKLNRLHCGQVGCRFCSGLCFVCFCLLLFASFCFAIVIVFAPNPFFLSLFILFLVACCLSLIRRLQTSGGSIPWLQSSAVLLLGPVPRPRRCSCSVPSFASAVLGSSAWPCCSFSAPQLIAFDSVLRTKPSASPRCSSSAVLRTKPAASVPLVPRRPQRSSVLRPRFGAPPRLLAFDSVLRTKPLASPRCSSLAPRCSPLAPRCSTLNLQPQCSSSVLSSGKILFSSTICHPFLILHFTHSTSTSLSHPADCSFSPLLFVSIFLDSLHSFFALFFASFPFTLFLFDYDSLRYKINPIKYPFSNQTKSNKNTIVTSKKYYCNIKKYCCNI
jgi:hypothetical protein